MQSGLMRADPEPRTCCILGSLPKYGHPPACGLSACPVSMLCSQNGAGAGDRIGGVPSFPWPKPDKPMMFWAQLGPEEISASGECCATAAPSHHRQCHSMQHLARDPSPAVSWWMVLCVVEQSTAFAAVCFCLLQPTITTTTTTTTHKHMPRPCPACRHKLPEPH